MMPFWIGLAVSSALAYPIYLMLLRLNSRQNVSEFAPETHQAKQGTPTMGGLIFVIPFVLLAPLIPRGDEYVTSSRSLLSTWAVSPPITITVLVLLFASIGLIDDFVVPRMAPGKRGLGWKQKLGMQFLAALAFGLMRSDGGWQLVFDVLVILACSNAYNFADGLDGLAASIGLLLIPGLIALTFASGQAAMATGQVVIIPLLMLVAGAMLPFAFLNAPKAKVFMGDVGSLPLGALVGAAVAIPIHPLPDWKVLIGANVLVLILAIELIPVPLQILWVKVLRRRLFPFTPIHHAFEKAGWQETRVVAMFALGQLLCTLGAVNIFDYVRTR